MSGHVNTTPHCQQPRRKRRWRGRVWWCNCGKAWRVERHYSHFDMSSHSWLSWIHVPELDYKPNEN